MPGEMFLDAGILRDIQSRQILAQFENEETVVFADNRPQLFEDGRGIPVRRNHPRFAGKSNGAEIDQHRRNCCARAGHGLPVHTL